MGAEKSLSPGAVGARGGAVCVECLSPVAAGAAVLDRTGATVCRVCAAEVYAPCAACGGLVPREEALTRGDDVEGDAAGRLYCAGCFRAGAAAGAGEEETERVADAEVEALVTEFVALHAEKKRLDARVEEVKERLKLAARARPRVGGAVVFRAGDDAGVRCSYASRTTYDAAKLEAAEGLIGGAEFAALFERKVSFTPVRNTLEAFLSSGGDGRDDARALIREAAQQTETETLALVAPPKKKKDSADAPQ